MIGKENYRCLTRVEIKTCKQRGCCRVILCVDEFVRVSITHQELLCQRRTGIMPVPNDNYSALRLLYKPSASVDPGIHEEVGNLQFSSHQTPELFNAHTQDPAVLRCATAKQRLPAAQDIQFSSELSLAEPRHCVEATIAAVLE